MVLGKIFEYEDALRKAKSGLYSVLMDAAGFVNSKGGMLLFESRSRLSEAVKIECLWSCL